MNTAVGHDAASSAPSRSRRLPPPNLARGPIAWVRENLFSGPVNTILTLARHLPPLRHRPAGRAVHVHRCGLDRGRPRRLPRGDGGAPGRGMLGLRFRQDQLLHLRLLSGRASAGGSTSSSRCSPSASAGCSGSRRRGAISARSISSSPSRSSPSTSSAAHRGCPCRKCRRRFGAASSSRCSSRRSASSSRCRSASSWRSDGARSCRSCSFASVIFIEFVRGVPLITVLIMANTMLPLFLPGDMTVDRLAAPARRRRALRLGLYGGGGARRPAGDAERPV